MPMGAVLKGRLSDQIGGRKPTGDKNTFRIGREENDSNSIGDEA